MNTQNSLIKKINRLVEVESFDKFFPERKRFIFRYPKAFIKFMRKRKNYSDFFFSQYSISSILFILRGFDFHT